VFAFGRNEEMQYEAMQGGLLVGSLEWLE